MKAIAKALLDVQKAMDSVHKGKSGYGYKYADLPAVMNACADALNDAGVLIVQAPATTDKQAAAIQTRLIHAETGEEISGTIEVPWAVGGTKMSDAQAYGSAMTYARRYALVSMLGIVTEDDDGASAGNRTAQRPTRPQPTPQPTVSLSVAQQWLEDADSIPTLQAAWRDVQEAGLAANPVLIALKDKRKAEVS